MNTAAQGLARIQSESRISANTWRDWCARLEIDLDEAVEVWDEICYPMALVARTMPDVAYVLRLRAFRRDQDILDFREEIPVVLHFNAFVGSLQDGATVGEKYRAAVLRYYQKSASKSSSLPRDTFVRSLLSDLCTALLLAKLLPAGKVNLSRLLTVLVEEKGTLGSFAGLALNSLSDKPFTDEVAQCLKMRAALAEALSSPTREAAASKADSEEDDEDERSGETGDPSDEDADYTEDDDAGEEGDGEEEDDEDEEDDGPEPDDEADEFVISFKTAIEAVYEAEAEADISIPEELLAVRQRAVSTFDPLHARIASPEEARSIVSKRVGDGGAGRERALRPQPKSGGGGAKSGPNPLMAARGTSSGSAAAPRSVSSAPGKSSSSTPLGAGGAKPAAAKIDRPSASTAAPAASTDASSTSSPTPPAAGSGGSDTADVELPATVASDEPLEVPRIAKTDLGPRVNLIGQLLGNLEQLDPRIWNLYSEPTADVDELCDLADALLTENSGAERAYAALRVVAQQQQLKALLTLPADNRLNERRFDLEAQAFINTVSSSRRSFESDSRQLVPLPKVLDHAAASLVRLEALKSSIKLARAGTEEFSAEAATKMYETVLSNVTYQADREMIESVRQKADADIKALAELVEAEMAVERVVASCEEYLQTLNEGGHTENVESLSAVFGSEPLQFEGIDPAGGPGKGLPEKFASSCGLGDILDSTREYMLGKVWSALQPIHQPEKVTQRVDDLIRAQLAGCARLPVRKERHENNPRVALSVVSLDKLSGSRELGHLFVRLSVDGKLLFVEDFEDGSYVDLFELCKNERKQMHARARGRAQVEATGELQTGSSYLHSMGRTNKPFGNSEREVMSGCVLTDEGEPRVYPTF